MVVPAWIVLLAASPGGGAVDGWIAPAALAEGLKARPGDVRTVDIRDDMDFARGHIRESLHMPAIEARHRGFLKRHDVVIVYGEGNPCPASDLAVRMRADGFTRVRVLGGGIEAWEAAGHPVEKEQDPASHPSRVPVRERGALSARELDALLRCPEINPVVIDVDGEMSPLLKGAARAPTITRAAPVGKDRDWRSPLVVVGSNARGTMEQAARLRDGKPGAAVFWLDGGVESWRMWTQTRSGFPAPEKCEGCGSRDPALTDETPRETPRPR